MITGNSEAEANEDRFSYLGDVLGMEGGAQEAVTSRIRSTWKIFKKVSNVIWMDVKRLVDRVDDKKSSVKALHMEVKRTKKKTK